MHLQELECGVVDLLNEAAVNAAEQAMTCGVDMHVLNESSDSIEEPVIPRQSSDVVDDCNHVEGEKQNCKKRKLVHELN